jgi:hypothetical protein
MAGSNRVASALQAATLLSFFGRPIGQAHRVNMEIIMWGAKSSRWFANHEKRLASLPLILLSVSAAAGPKNPWTCDRAQYGAVIVNGNGDVPATLSADGKVVTFVPDANKKQIGAADIKNAASNVQTIIVQLSGQSLLVDKDATVDLTQYKTDFQIVSNEDVVVAGALQQAPHQSTVIDAKALDQITCPQDSKPTRGTCPGSNGMHGDFIGGNLTIKNVPDGVGESSCPGGQIVAQDIDSLTLSPEDLATANSPRLCINVHTIKGHRLKFQGSIGANRLVNVRVYDGVRKKEKRGSADVDISSAGPGFRLMIGGNTDLCYN